MHGVILRNVNPFVHKHPAVNDTLTCLLHAAMNVDARNLVAITFTPDKAKVYHSADKFIHAHR
jgi:hypothetical protein